eukprot:tig00001038_g6519.t1
MRQHRRGDERHPLLEEEPHARASLSDSASLTESEPTSASSLSSDEQPDSPAPEPSSSAPGPSGSAPRAAEAGPSRSPAEGAGGARPEPSPMYLIQGPDGTVIGMAVDPNAPKPPPPEPPPEDDEAEAAAAAAEARIRAALVAFRSPSPALGDESDPYMHLEYALYLRRRRSFLFLLCFECSYYLLCLMFALALLNRVGGPSSPLQCLVLFVPVAVDLVGFVGAVKGKVHVLTLFVMLEGVSICVGAFEELSIMIMIRLLILVLGMQVREGMLRWRALEEHYFRRPEGLDPASHEVEV